MVFPLGTDPVIIIQGRLANLFSSYPTKMTLSIWISIAALLLSTMAMYFTFKKDAHRIRVHHGTVSGHYFDEVSINNDSSFPVRVAAIGHVDINGRIAWIDYFFDIRANKTESYPLLIEGRNTYLCGINPRKQKARIPNSDTYGYCVQLQCNRTFVSTNTLPWPQILLLKSRELISRISQGKWGFQRSRIHLDF